VTTGRGATRAALALVAAIGWCAGGGARGRGDPGRDDSALVLLRTDVHDAAIWIDDRFVGLIADARAGMSVSPGTHRVEIRHDRYHTRYLELTVRARERVEIPIELAERFD
jgi:hypothetical protein